MNVSLFSAKVLKKLGIRGHLFNSIKQRDVNTTYLKISIISHVVLPFFSLANLSGKGALGMYFRGLQSSLSFVDGSSDSWVVFVTSISTLLSTSLPFCKVMTALTSSWCWDKLVLTSCTPLGLGIGWLGHFPFLIVIAKVWTEEVSWPSIISRFEIDWACELKPTLISFRNLSMVRWVECFKF